MTPTSKSELSNSQIPDHAPKKNHLSPWKILVTLSTLFLLLNACVEPAAPTTSAESAIITSTPTLDAYPKETTSATLSSPEAIRPRHNILFIGDSLIQNGGGEALQQALIDAGVEADFLPPAGYPGYTWRRFLQELESYQIQISPETTHIFIWFGTNDPRNNIPLEETQKNILATIALLQTRANPGVDIAIIPVPPSRDNLSINAYIEKMNQRTAELAQSVSTPDHLVLLAPDLSFLHDNRDFYSNDGVHLMPIGEIAVAQVTTSIADDLGLFPSNP